MKTFGRRRGGARRAPASRPAAGRALCGGRDSAADPTRAAEVGRVRSCHLACDPRLTRSAQPELQTLCLLQIQVGDGPRDMGPLLSGRRATFLARPRLQRIRLDARSLFGIHHGDVNRVRDSRRGAPSQAAGPSCPLPTCAERVALGAVPERMRCGRCRGVLEVELEPELSAPR